MMAGMNLSSPTSGTQVQVSRLHIYQGAELAAPILKRSLICLVVRVNNLPPWSGVGALTLIYLLQSGDKSQCWF